MKTRVQTGTEFMEELFGKKFVESLGTFQRKDIIQVLKEADEIKQYSGGIDLYADGWSDAVDFIASRLHCDY